MSNVQKLVNDLRAAAQIIMQNLNTFRYNQVFNDLERSAEALLKSDLKKELQDLRAKVNKFPLTEVEKIELSNQLKLLAGDLANTSGLLKEPLRIQNQSRLGNYVDPPSLSAIQIKKPTDEFEKPTEHVRFDPPLTLAVVEIEESWHNTGEVEAAAFFGDLPPPSIKKDLLPPGFTEDVSNSKQSEVLEAQTIGEYFAEGDAMSGAPQKKKNFEERAKEVIQMLFSISILGLVVIMVTCTVRMNTFQDTLTYLRAQKQADLALAPRLSLAESLPEKSVQAEVIETVVVNEEPATSAVEPEKTKNTVIVYVPEVRTVSPQKTDVSEHSLPTKVRIKPPSNDQPVRCDGEFAFSNLLWRDGQWWGLRSVECKNGLYTITVGAYEGETIRTSCLNAETGDTPWCHLVQRF